ncbi:MAG: hypothetical protein Q4E13_15440 [Clostridia bacterium]|nr:hypothetical protein [Clostridia bacterium]
MFTKKRIVLLIVATLTMLAQVAMAEVGNGIEPNYTSTEKVYATLTISGEKAKVDGESKGSLSDATTKLTVSLQRRPTGGSTWSTLATWTDQASGKAQAIVKKTYDVDRGNDYRVKAVSKIVNKEGVILETVTKYSGIKSY